MLFLLGWLFWLLFILLSRLLLFEVVAFEVLLAHSFFIGLFSVVALCIVHGVLFFFSVFHAPPAPAPTTTAKTNKCLPQDPTLLPYLLLGPLSKFHLCFFKQSGSKTKAALIQIAYKIPALLLLLKWLVSSYMVQIDWLAFGFGQTDLVKIHSQYLKFLFEL